MLILAVALPLVPVLLLAWRPVRRFAIASAPWTALPSLWLALSGRPVTPLEAPWLLLGARLALDEPGRVFLLFTSSLWAVAAVYARAYLSSDPGRSRFFAFLLVTMFGNLGVIVAGDMITFYLFFAVMGFATYGLVVHTGDPVALRAGRIYIGLVIVGELLLFTGIMAVAAITGRVDMTGAPAVVAASPSGALVTGLLLAGFGVKAGALPLHMWLPLAHPAAPTPASAILSGALIKAGLLGWLRFLPLGQIALPGWGEWCVIAGLAAAFGGVLAGVTQTDPKSALAYSSISQMGLLTVGIGAGLLAPAAWPVLLTAVLLYATHHALAKGALFLGIGVAAATAGQPSTRRRLVLGGLIVPALALAGAPLTSGAASKVALKNALDMAPGVLGSIDLLLSCAAVGTTVLMARVLYLVMRPSATGPVALTPGLWSPWLALLGLVLLLVWVAPLADFREAAAGSLVPGAVWSTAWPPILGVALAWFAWSRPALVAWRTRLHVPPGDIVWPILRVSRPVLEGAVRWHRRRPIASRVEAFRRARPARDRLPILAARLERGLAGWYAAGVLLLSVAVALLALLA